MNKARKMVVVLLMVFGAVSVAMGEWIPEADEANYQKLKAEMAEYGNAEECKWSEDGKKLISERSESLNDLRLCKFQKVVLFFDEIRAIEITKKQASRWGICFGEKKWKTCDKYDKFRVAIKEVREMPLFKNDSIFYARASDSYTGGGNLERFWERWIGKYDFDGEWNKIKIEMEIDGARRGYWKKLAE